MKLKGKSLDADTKRIMKAHRRAAARRGPEQRTPTDEELAHVSARVLGRPEAGVTRRPGED